MSAESLNNSPLFKSVIINLLTLFPVLTKKNIILIRYTTLCIISRNKNQHIEKFHTSLRYIEDNNTLNLY